MAIKKYTVDNIGCYVDSSRGIYAVDKIVEFAENQGYRWSGVCEDESCIGDRDSFEEHPKPSDCDWNGDIEDEATEYMNDNHPVDGAYWGRNENSDWGLWANKEDDNEIEPSEPEEGDITTTDHISFYQYGKLWLEVPFARYSTFKHGKQIMVTSDERADYKKAVKAQMEIDQFYPNVWFISDHGNAHLLSL